MKRIKHFFQKPYRFAICFGMVLMAFNVYVLLQTFLLSSVTGYVKKTDNPSGDKPTNVTITDTSYTDDNISVNIETIRKHDTNIYIAEVKLSSAKYLQTALAHDTVGKNITQKTSEIAKEHGAIFAVNGDYYGAHTHGYVIKNGEIYRTIERSDEDYEDLVIYEDGSFGFIYEEETSPQKLLDEGVYNLFMFGPSLIKDGEISIDEDEEIPKSMSDNPRTAIGYVDELHYIFRVSDGRSDESEGLKLYEMAEIMKEYGCSEAYNLDGGGSSTMYFNGKVINKPTTDGKKIKERSVSDIVYIGY